MHLAEEAEGMIIGVRGGMLTGGVLGEMEAPKMIKKLDSRFRVGCGPTNSMEW